MQSNREYDMGAERIIVQFLKERLYPQIFIEPPIWFDGKEDQLKGTDLRVSIDGQKNRIVDVKCAHDHLKTDISEKSIPTFAFELSFCKQDKEIEGWLYDRSKETQYYLVCWLWAKKKNNFNLGDILKLECLLLERQKVLYFLAKNGLYPQDALKINHIIRESGREGRHFVAEFPEFKLQDAFYFFYTKNKVERPINIIINKKYLFEIATTEKEFVLYP